MDEDEKYQQIRLNLCNIPFWRLLGLEIVSLEEGFARLRLPANVNFTNSKGTVHGGIISSLIDCGTGTALKTILPLGQGTSTVELKLNYLIPAAKGELIVEGHVIRCGRTLAVSAAEVKDGNGNLLAVGSASHILFERKGDKNYGTR